MFVKICGITSEDALAAAVAAGADAVGFVFAESVRQVSPEQAAALSAGLPAGIKRIAVMRHPAADTVAAVLEVFRPDWLQTEAEDFTTIELPAGIEALPVYRNGRLPAGFGIGDRIGNRTSTTNRNGAVSGSGHGNDDGEAAAIPARLLFEGAVSGTGETADWDEARTLATRTQMVLAGGLNAENVADAIRYVRPWGVDVSSGVEASRGVKDPEKIKTFVARVRAMENGK